MKHIRTFDNAEQAETVLSVLEYITLSAIRGESIVTLKPGVIPPPLPDPTIPFYIDVRGPVTLAATSGLQMSTDGETWTNTVAGDLPTGKTYFRVASDQTSPLKPNWTEKSDSDYDIGGNINSLVKTSFKNDTTCYNFASYFKNKANLKSAGDLILPATTLADSCYNDMFSGCTSLTTAPALPATTLAMGCYIWMFGRCTSLSAAPALPATTLAQGCYANMFQLCTALTAAPELPATTLTKNCYQNMFNGCMALTTAPDLPATTLTNYCYESMFTGCTSLNHIKCLATYKSATSCTTGWVDGVASTGTFVKNPSMTGWPTGTSGIPSGWTVEDA